VPFVFSFALKKLCIASLLLASALDERQARLRVSATVRLALLCFLRARGRETSLLHIALFSKFLVFFEKALQECIKSYMIVLTKKKGVCYADWI
jgi:hypothetical protein